MKKSANILHIFNDPKFSSGYFEFLIRKNVNLDKHTLFHYRCTENHCNSYGMEAVFSPHFFSIIPNLKLLYELIKAKKIIIHSLASPFLLLYLFLLPNLARKAYWAIWGKDLYFFKIIKKPRLHHKIYEFFRKRVIKRISNIISISHRDVALAKKWYGSTAMIHHCFGYPSNCYKEFSKHIKRTNTILILVGNSADPSNNHFEAFSMIEKFKDEDIKVITLLSYGDHRYAKKVIKTGKALFGKKFIAIEKLLPLTSYYNLLATVDIGIFAHKRQQAMGAIISLLGMKKKVYLRKDITTWGTLFDLGITVYDLNDFNFIKPDKIVLDNNYKIIKNYFTEENLLCQWLQIFDHRP